MENVNGLKRKTKFYHFLSRCFTIFPSSTVKSFCKCLQAMWFFPSMERVWKMFIIKIWFNSSNKQEIQWGKQTCLWLFEITVEEVYDQRKTRIFARVREMVKNNKYYIFGFRVVVLFEDCCKKVELHMKYLKLQRTLAEKMFELRSLELQEKRILKGTRKCVQTTVMLFARCLRSFDRPLREG